MSEWDPDYDGYWPKDPEDAIHEDEQWDDPDDILDGYEDHTAAAFEEFLDATADLVDVLNRGRLVISTNSDIVALTRMNGAWARFVDPSYSHPASGSRSARIVLWECPEHYVTLMFVGTAWRFSFTAPLVTDSSRLEDSDFAIESDIPGLVDDETDLDSADDDRITDGDEYEPHKARRDLMLEGLLSLGFPLDEILLEFGTSAEASRFHSRLERRAAAYLYRVSAFVRIPGEANLTLLHRWMDIGEALEAEYRRDWFLLSADSEFARPLIARGLSFAQIVAQLTAVRYLAMYGSFFIVPT